LKKIFEVAKAHEISPLEAVEIFNKAGVRVRNHMQKVSDEDIEKFSNYLKSLNEDNCDNEDHKNDTKISLNTETISKNSIEIKSSYLEKVIKKNPSIRRTVSPDLSELCLLPTPLELGEIKVLEFFLRHLDCDWEIYIQPHLNGLRPDFVLLHPERGIAVFEVKDWALTKMDYFFKGKKLFARKNGTTFCNEKNNPFPKVIEYSSMIHKLFCPSFGSMNKKDFRVISKGVIFPNATKSELLNLLGDEYSYERGFKSFNLVSKEDLDGGFIEDVFSNSKRRDELMNDVVAQELRSWLVEPDVSIDQRTKVVLNRAQKKLATTRAPRTGLRRIKGAGGSGKTLVLAARAVNLAKDGKRVLFCTFNITLINYLRDISVRFIRDKNVLRNIEFHNYHAWCKKVCIETGFSNEYNSLENKLEASLLVSKILKDGDFNKYDAILVDEGQDFSLEWWNTLRLAIVVSGEMVLAVDPTQDVYEKAKNWTEERMSGAGFVGSWSTLETSYRMPFDYIPMVKDFAKKFISNDEFRILPEPLQNDLFHIPTQIKWIQVDDCSESNKICSQEVLRFNNQSESSRSWADLVILCDRKNDGKEIVDFLNSKHINVIHTFYDDDKEERRRKRAFYKGDSRVKATTIHSYKGWETSSLVINISSSEEATPAIIYTALTRLKSSEKGAIVTIVCSNETYREFGLKWNSGNH
jgi:cellulose biosynthesis protein BcsQ